MFKFIFLVAALVAVSSGYNLKQRSKRDTDTTDKCHGHWERNIHCCNGDTFDKTEFEKFAEAKHECVKQIWGDDEEPSYDPFSCEQLKEVKEQTKCVAQCIMQKESIVDDKGNVKRDALIEHLKRVFKDTEWKVKATDGLVDKCMASLKEVTVGEKECNPAAMHFIHCMWKGYIQTCPKELQSDRWRCQKIREKIEKGDETYLNRVHLHKFIRHHDHEHKTTE